VPAIANVMRPPRLAASAPPARIAAPKAQESIASSTPKARPCERSGIVVWIRLRTVTMKRPLPTPATAKASIASGRFGAAAVPSRPTASRAIDVR